MVEERADLAPVLGYQNLYAFNTRREPKACRIAGRNFCSAWFQDDKITPLVRTCYATRRL